MSTVIKMFSLNTAHSHDKEVLHLQYLSAEKPGIPLLPSLLTTQVGTSWVPHKLFQEGMAWLSYQDIE